MPERHLSLKPLTAAAFAAFGDVIEVLPEAQSIAINYGMTERYHDLAKLDVGDADGHALLSIFRSLPIELPFPIRLLERHPLGSQAFMPLGANPYVVVVAPAGELNPAAIEAFLVQPGQGVNYHKGTWHHYCLALHQRSDFLVIDRGGAGDNCDELTLPEQETLYVAR